MDKISAYEDRALASLKGKWKDAVITTLVYVTIGAVLSLSLTLPFVLNKVENSVVNFVSILLFPFGWGYMVYFLNLVRGKYQLKDIFDGYKSNYFVRTMLTILLYAILIFIGSILLIVPGIIMACMFSQVYFIMKDDESIGYWKALSKSMDMMKGHKMQYFLLYLSFIGWVLLALLIFMVISWFMHTDEALWGLGLPTLLALGIFLMWLIPYMYTTFAHYYEDVKAEYEAKNAVITEA